MLELSKRTICAYVIQSISKELDNRLYDEIPRDFDYRRVEYLETYYDIHETILRHL